MLTPYWIYVGNRMDDLPFTIYAFLMADYFTGSYVCRGFSHEMSMKLQAKCEEQGAQYEFNQEVEKILVRDGKVYGVRTARGDEIHCDYVISGPYPNRVYSQMIEPLTEVPAGAIRMINNRKLSVTPVSVIMVIEGTPEENGIINYSTFSGTTMDTNKIWENYSNITEPYNYITTICLNYANPTLPEGYTQLSITALVPSKPFENIKEEDYFQRDDRRVHQDHQGRFPEAHHRDRGHHTDDRRPLCGRLEGQHLRLSPFHGRPRRGPSPDEGKGSLHRGSGICRCAWHERRRHGSADHQRTRRGQGRTRGS